MTTYIALLRGINVGGNNKVKMAELREMLEELKFEAPKTLLQSGNVVFRSPKKGQEELEKTLEDATERRFGIRPDYMVRTAKEWQAAIDANPFPDEAKADPSHLLVFFMKEKPDAAAVKAVQDAITGPERMAVAGDNLYVVFPEGIGTSKVDRTPGYNKLIKRGTARNWNTVVKLAALAALAAGDQD